MFSQAQYEAVIREIDSGMTSFQAKLGEVVPTADAAMSSPFIPPPVAEGFKWIAEKTVEVGTAILEWFKDLLKGAAAPIFMFIDAWHWMDVKGVANGVSTDLSGANLVVDDADWSGQARDAYLSAAGAQSGAAARVGSIANGTSVNLMVSAVAGLAFYVTLATVLAKLIARAGGLDRRHGLRHLLGAGHCPVPRGGRLQPRLSSGPRSGRSAGSWARRPPR